MKPDDLIGCVERMTDDQRSRFRVALYGGEAQKVRKPPAMLDVIGYEEWAEDNLSAQQRRNLKINKISIDPNA